MWVCVKFYIWGLMDYCFLGSLCKCQRREGGCWATLTGIPIMMKCWKDTYRDGKWHQRECTVGRKMGEWWMESKAPLKYEICVLEREFNLGLLRGSSNSSQMSVKPLVCYMTDVLLWNCWGKGVRSANRCFRHKPSIQCRTKSTHTHLLTLQLTCMTMPLWPTSTEYSLE